MCFIANRDEYIVIFRYEEKGDVFFAEMLGTCIGVAVLAILYEGLKVLRERIDTKYRCQTHCDSNGQVATEDGGKSMTVVDSTTASSKDCHAEHRRKQK